MTIDDVRTNAASRELIRKHQPGRSRPDDKNVGVQGLSCARGVCYDAAIASISGARCKTSGSSVTLPALP
jgi:hypothetical protein